MKPAKQSVVGIDVGGKRKGFHAVALSDGKFGGKLADPNPGEIVNWCLKQKATAVAVDAPCRWSKSGNSRYAEQQLKIGGRKINCYATPTRKMGKKNKFYRWVVNGENLYKRLKGKFTLFEGNYRKRNVCFETFPHAIVCFLAGKVVRAKPKRQVRRAVLKHSKLVDKDFPNIDFVDAALCAITAQEFLRGNYQPFGDRKEGFIVVPKKKKRR